MKRQKTSSNLYYIESDAMKEGREGTFLGWNNASISASRMIEAGFAYCNKTDRVICLYCGLICHRWDGESDDPCQVHQLLSPNCLFVKLMSCCHSPQYNQVTSILPHHCDYMNPQNRVQSFSNWTKSGFPSTEQLVEAGFFHKDQQIVCFYCNGSLFNWDTHHHPIAEHVRLFPFCNYARQLCGEELYYPIQQLKHDRGLKD